MTPAPDKMKRRAAASRSVPEAPEGDYSEDDESPTTSQAARSEAGAGDP